MYHIKMIYDHNYDLSFLYNLRVIYNTRIRYAPNNTHTYYAIT